MFASTKKQNEEEFNISIPDDSAEKIRTMEDLTNYIEGKIK